MSENTSELRPAATDHLPERGLTLAAAFAERPWAEDVYLAGSASAPFLGALIWGRGGYAVVLPILILLSILGLTLYLLAQRHTGASPYS